MRRGSTAVDTASMGFSFGEKGERPTLAGTGVPVRVCLAQARRLGTGLGRPAWDEGPTPCGVGLRSMGSNREAAIHVHASARRSTVTHGCQSSQPGRSRETRGQVSTATPAALDFRTAEAVDEGLVDAMSTGSLLSMGSGGRRGALPRHRHPKATATQAGFQPPAIEVAALVRLACVGRSSTVARGVVLPFRVARSGLRRTGRRPQGVLE